jgi:DNA-binding MarR family transcriptional regulator
MQRPLGPFATPGKHAPPPPQTLELPFHVEEIAGDLGRSEKSVHKSIKRLKRRGKIERLGEGWRLRIAP